jgi:hypothetical protein
MFPTPLVYFWVCSTNVQAFFFFRTGAVESILARPCCPCLVPGDSHPVTFPTRMSRSGTFELESAMSKLREWESMITKRDETFIPMKARLKETNTEISMSKNGISRAMRRL